MDKIILSFFLLSCVSKAYSENNGAPLGEALFGLFAMFLGLWVFIVGALVLGYKSKSKFWRFFYYTLAIIPFVHYFSMSIYGYIEGEKRKEIVKELNSSITKITLENRIIEVFRYTLDEKEIWQLLTKKIVNQIQFYDDRNSQTITYSLYKNNKCIENAKTTPYRYLSQDVQAYLAKNNFELCVIKTTKNGLPQSTIQLFGKRISPNSYPLDGVLCFKNGYQVFELRQAPRYGGALIKFWENPNYTHYAIPPFFDFPHVKWVCSGSSKSKNKTVVEFLSEVFPPKIDTYPINLNFLATQKAIKILFDDNSVDVSISVDNLFSLFGQHHYQEGVDDILLNDKYYNVGTKVALESNYYCSDTSALFNEKKDKYYPYIDSYCGVFFKMRNKWGGNR